MTKGRRSSARVVARDSRNNANMKYKGTTFVPIIALVTLMQLNRMLMMWKIQQAKQDKTDDSFEESTTVTWLKCSNGTIFQPAYRDLGN